MGRTSIKLLSGTWCLLHPRSAQPPCPSCPQVCEVVEANFSDARSAGYDRQQWQQLKEAALARPLRDRAAAYRWGASLQLRLVHALLLFRGSRDATRAGLALSRAPPAAPASRSTIRELLAALRDPYTRFVSPDEFRAMLK